MLWEATLHMDPLCLRLYDPFLPRFPETMTSQYIHKSIDVTTKIFSLSHPGTSFCLNHTTTWLSPFSKTTPSLEDPPLPTALVLTNSVPCSGHHCESFQDLKVFLILCLLPPSPRNTPLCEPIKGHETCASVEQTPGVESSLS